MKKKIFIVDDDEVEVLAIKRALNNLAEGGKFELDYFMDGEAVINRLEEMLKRNLYLDKTMPQFMLLDLNMPRMNGFEVLERIRNNHQLRFMVVFILSTSKNAQEIKRAYCNNVAGYLVKDEMGNRYEKLSELLETYTDTVAFPLN